MSLDIGISLLVIGYSKKQGVPLYRPTELWLAGQSILHISLHWGPLPRQFYSNTQHIQNKEETSNIELRTSNSESNIMPRWLFSCSVRESALFSSIRCSTLNVRHLSWERNSPGPLPVKEDRSRFCVMLRKTQSRGACKRKTNEFAT